MAVMDGLQKVPKWVLVAGGVVLIGLLGWGMVRFAFGDKLSKPKEEKQKIIDFPDANEEEKVLSKVEQAAQSVKQSGSSANDYWNSLAGGESNSDGGLASSSSASAKGSSGGSDGSYNGEYLDPSVYSELEIYYIKRGIRTKAEVDRKHEELRRIDEENERAMQELAGKQEQNSDSAYFARLERAYQMAQKYTREPDEVNAPAPQQEAEPEPRKIDVEVKSIPSTTLAEDGIITSLETGPVSGGVNRVDGQMVVSPAKATFLKSETLVPGQRVIMRLMQDLRLSDGTLIPSNTHVSGICSIGSRLEIKISTINYGGRIYYTDIDVFDNDGTEGIYCPVIVDKKAGKKLGRQIAQAATQIAGTVASASSPYAAMVARTGTQELMSLSIDSQGNKSVKVSAGYEFYMFENTEDKK